MKTAPRRVDKPWGHEILWAETDLYVGKILHVKEGEALSVQAHRVKDETLYLLTGAIRLEAGDHPDRLKDVDLRRGESFRVRPGTVHRIVAITDADILEASTPHLDDVVRFRDRYGRAPDQAGEGRPS